jgi:hypothetical protein
MTGDALGTATSALRETSGAPAGDETLARVLRDVRAARRRRRALGVVALPLAFALTGVGAWAATTGRLADVARRLWPARAAWSGAAPARPAATLAGPEIVPLVSAPVAPPPPAAPPPGGRVALPAHPAARTPPAALAPPPDVEVAAAPTADELYRAAHEAHFVARDFEAALARWDRYLALVPLPPLAVEARYNRAIALFRLRRHAQAAQALRPFADGDYGSYRAAEARSLLDALGPTRGPRPEARGP